MAKLLIVDDSEIIRKGLKRILNDSGFNDVIEAQDGRDGLKKITTENVSLVFLDLEMPKLNGIQVLHAIRASETTHDLPVVIITSHTAREKIVSTAKAGISGYLVKPFTREAVQEKLKEIGFLADDESVPEINRIELGEDLLKCPHCGSEKFFMKKAEDMVFFKISAEKKPLFEKPMEIGFLNPEDIVSYCSSCSWHGKLNELPRSAG